MSDPPRVVAVETVEWVEAALEVEDVLGLPNMLNEIEVWECVLGDFEGLLLKEQDWRILRF